MKEFIENIELLEAGILDSVYEFIYYCDDLSNSYIIKDLLSKIPQGGFLYKAILQGYQDGLECRKGDYLDVKEEEEELDWIELYKLNSLYNYAMK